ncbi:MAG: hypothetical protein OEV66_10930 [Spirochaetia bacterium]|nr:hypothetical protein [Spirochaetia bacterium]
MNALLRISGSVILLFIFIQIPVIKITTPASVNPVYYYDLKERHTLTTSMNFPRNNFIFHLPVSGDFTSSHQYDITKLDNNGNSILSFRMPSAQNVSGDRSTTYLLGKDGFVTYPENGSFFLWYPKLGNHTFFYDQEGQFLWAHRTSHYMKAFPSGNYILSMTGDHSRVFYMMPDLSVIGSTEGTLLINYEFFSLPDSNKSMQVCLGFLDGDVVFYNPASKGEIRINTGSVTKAVACDFKSMYIAVQMENPDKNIAADILALGKIDELNKNPGIQWKFKIPLLQRYTETLPLGLGQDYGIIVLPEKKSTEIFAFDFSGNIISKFTVKSESAAEDWRISHAGRNMIVWNSNEVYVFNPEKIFDKQIHINNLSVEGNEIFIEEPGGILALQLFE